MFFIVPGDDSPNAKAPSVKVELDIDDAPFLDEPKVEKAPEKAPEAPAKAAEEPKKAAAPKGPSKIALFLANKKRLAIIGGGVAFILIAPLILSFFMSGKAPEKNEPVKIPLPEVELPEGPKAPAFSYQGDSFFVERRGSENEIRFLRFRFSIPTEDSIQFGELQAKNIVIRDAIYYYLSNKDLMFLTDSKMSESLKADLITVINEHISGVKVDDIYIEEYLVTGLK